MAGTRRASSYEFQFRRRVPSPCCWNTSRHPRLTRLLRRRGSLKSLKRSGCCARIGKDNRIFPSTTSSRAPRCNRTRQACPKGWIARGASSRLRQDVCTRRAMVSPSNWSVRCACVDDRFPARVVPAATSPSESNLASFTAPEFPHMRLLACETCKAYLLVVDLERDPAAIPEVDELAGLSSGPLGQPRTATTSCNPTSQAFDTVSGSRRDPVTGVASGLQNRFAGLCFAGRFDSCISPPQRPL